MADTRVQLDVENWIREQWMTRQFNAEFTKQGVRLTSGGVFEFDAVSEDGLTVAAISTSGARTASGKLGVGKIMKIRSDILFLILAEATRRLLVLSQTDMYEWCPKEQERGRLPWEIEIVRAELPVSLRDQLISARKASSSEVTPTKEFG